MTSSIVRVVSGEEAPGGNGEVEVAARVAQIKRLMGPKKVFSGDSTERRDLEVIQVFLQPQGSFTAPVGLRVDARVLLGD